MLPRTDVTIVSGTSFHMPSSLWCVSAHQNIMACVHCSAVVDVHQDTVSFGGLYTSDSKTGSAKSYTLR